MTIKQFKNLKVGDICLISGGYDHGRLCQVAFIEDYQVLVRSADGKPFKSANSRGRLRLTGWMNLQTID